MRIAFQGEPGAYSEGAILEHFGQGHEMVPCRTFREVLDRLHQRTADAAVLPVENTQTGIIGEAQRLLQHAQIQPQRAFWLRIQHCLLGNPGSELADIRDVYSHPQALAQCRTFLSARQLTAHEFYDTAGAARWVKESGRRDAAAIAGARAAQVYGLALLQVGIEADPANATRFVVLGA